MTHTTFESVTARVGQLDWSQLVRQLDEQGFAVTKPVLSAEECVRLLTRSGNLDMKIGSVSRVDEIFARGVTMFQIAIAVAAISALTAKRRFWIVSLVFGAAGCVFLVLGYAAH